MTVESVPAIEGEAEPKAETDPKRSFVRAGFRPLSVAPVNEMPDSGICLVIYGKPGVGKTTLCVEGAADSPYGRPVVYLDAEGGRKAIKHRRDVATPKPEISKFSEFEAWADWAMNDPNFPYKSVVIDNMSEIQAMSIKEIAPKGSPDQRDWMVSTNDLLSLVRKWRLVAAKRGINVFIIAWDKPEEDANKVIHQRLGVTPSFGNQLPGIVDVVGILSVEPNGVTRRLSFAPSPLNQAKFRRSKTESAAKIPLTITYTDQNVLGDILNTLRADSPWPTAKYARGPQAAAAEPAPASPAQK